ncbi:hypothetical protein CDAR_113001 [Caerostris darwini]|uniref:Uncharacterized protein n=1 Tax=Caerostris darwini TaxID=1538125 RepID=A0AAV4Q016_9ARAC|nr:hypothetical protein CDAR_113001 [Caerostris darwini]
MSVDKSTSNTQSDASGSAPLNNSISSLSLGLSLFPKFCYNCQVPLQGVDIPINNGRIEQDVKNFTLQCLTCKHLHLIDNNSIRLFKYKLMSEERETQGGETE